MPDDTIETTEEIELSPEQVDALTVTAVVDGEEKQVSVKDLRASYQKDAAASERLRQATESAKENAEAIEIGQAMRAAKSGDTDALVKAMTKLGFDREQVAEEIATITQTLQGGDEPESGGGSRQPSKAPAGPADVYFSKLFHQYGLTPDEVADIVGSSIHQEGKNNRHRQIKGFLDSDKELTTILGKRGTDPNALIGLVDKVLLGQISGTGAKVSEHTIKQAVLETASILKAVRANAATGGVDSMDPFSAAALEEFGPGKTPKRPSSTSGEDYETYLQKKMTAKFRQKSLERAES